MSNVSCSFPIVLVSMDKGKSGDQAVSLLGAFMIQQILNAAFARGINSTQPRFNLYGTNLKGSPCLHSKIFFTEARKNGVATVVAHQERSQIGS